MAFEFVDWFMQYTKRGSPKTLCNVARSDEDSEVERYYAFLNETGSYVIQQITTSGSLNIKVYKYYASNKKASLDTDWTGRAALTYVEYNDLFRQK